MSEAEINPGIKVPRGASELVGRLKTIAANQPGPSPFEDDHPFSTIRAVFWRFLGPPRLTLRSLMLMMLLIAVLLGGIAEFLRERAAETRSYHGRQERRLLQLALTNERKAAAAARVANGRREATSADHAIASEIIHQVGRSRRRLVRLKEIPTVLKNREAELRIAARRLRVQAEYHGSLARP